MRNVLFVFGLSLAAFGCGSSGDTTSAAASTGGMMNPANEVRFDTASYTVKAGEEVKYFCYTMTLPADTETIVDQITPIYGKATHHLGVYYTLSKEPEGVFQCPELVRANWIPLYGGGVESGTLKMPEGAGVKLNKGQQILVQLHLLNAGAQDIQDKATIVFTKSPTANVVPAGIYGMDNRAVKIPAASKDFGTTMDCTVDKDMDVFAVFGHMHTMGKRIELSRGATAGAEVLYNDTWDFNNQPTTPKTFSLKKGENIHLRCWYDNNGPGEVTYGESTNNEMCSFVLYHTPYTSLDGCLKSP